MSRILVVEDEQHLADGLRFNLEAEGYEVELAETGEAALELLAVRAPAPVTRCSLRLSTTVGRPRGGNPISTTACFAGPEIQRAASTSTKA